MGRALKGIERKQIAAKPNGPLAEVIEENASALGMSKGDYIVAIAAYALGMPEHAPQPEHNLETLDGLDLGDVLLPASVAASKSAPVTDIRSSTRPKKEPRRQIAS